MGNAGSFGYFVTKILNLFQFQVYPILFTIATVIFIAGLIRYLYPGDSEENVSKGRVYIVYGIATLFVMYAVWWLAILLSNTFFRF